VRYNSDDVLPIQGCGHDSTPLTAKCPRYCQRPSTWPGSGTSAPSLIRSMAEPLTGVWASSREGQLQLLGVESDALNLLNC